MRERLARPSGPIKHRDRLRALFKSSGHAVLRSELSRQPSDQSRAKPAAAADSNRQGVVEYRARPGARRLCRESPLAGDGDCGRTGGATDPMADEKNDPVALGQCAPPMGRSEQSDESPGGAKVGTHNMEKSLALKVVWGGPQNSARFRSSIPVTRPRRDGIGFGTRRAAGQ